MSTSPPTSTTGPRRFSILSLLILTVMGLCAGSFLLAVAGFLGLLFIIMLYLGAKIVMWVAGAMILIFVGG